MVVTRLHASWAPEHCTDIVAAIATAWSLLSWARNDQLCCSSNGVTAQIEP